MYSLLYIIIIIYNNAIVNYPTSKNINTPTVIGVIVIAIIGGGKFCIFMQSKINRSNHTVYRNQAYTLP